ncbi:potassium channel family protein [Geodermatophilus amargosae]|uniref:potassium channel family protein n=1 Tax=Geodermatophilus amargosae TaxID=1296565 RepID=UPI0034DFB381
MYPSIVSLATLGFGDIVPESSWLRIAVPVQALVGFVLLIAAVTWVLQVYPALNRRRALALRPALLERTGPSVPDAGLLREVAGDLVRVRVDLTQHAETCYSGDVDAGTALPRQLPVALRPAHTARSSPGDAVRAGGAYLALVLEDLTGVLDRPATGPGSVGPRSLG